jgi:hypothetical protein
MNNGGFARIKYYPGQLLTARDFEDQQEYHRGKQNLLLRRFPAGIIGGLVVTCQPKGADPDDFEAFLIGEGLAVDPEGRELVVPEGGLKVPIDGFKDETPYLSLLYDEGEEAVGGDLCGSNQKSNRVKELTVSSWDPAPNMGSHITVALIQLKDVKDRGTTCDKYKDPMKPDVNVGDPSIRKNARVVDTDQITDGAITEKKIRTGSVTAVKLASNAVVTDKILDEAVTDNKLANNSVTIGKIQNGAVTADKLADDAVVTEKIEDGAVTDTKLASNAVATDNIQNVAVTADKLAPDAVATDRIQNMAVTAGKLDNDAVATVKIQNGAVTDVKLATNAVATVKIQTAAVTADKLAPNAVVGAKISDGAVTQAKLADGAVITDKIQSGAVTTDKLADNAVTSLKLKLIKTVHSGTLVARAPTATSPTFVALPPLSISPNAIVNVVPTNEGELTWNFSVKGGATGGRVIYNITIVNPGTVTVAFDVKEILFN